MTPKLEDRLIAAISNGDRDSITLCHEEAFRLYAPLLLFIAMQTLPCAIDAEEAVNEAFASLMRRSSKAKISSIKYYLVQTVKRIAVRMIDKSTSGAEYNDEMITEFSQKDRNAEFIDIETALSSLNQEERTVVLYKEFYGYKFKEIGEKLGISESAASSKYTRSLSKTRAALGLSEIKNK